MSLTLYDRLRSTIENQSDKNSTLNCVIQILLRSNDKNRLKNLVLINVHIWMVSQMLLDFNEKHQEHLSINCENRIMCNLCCKEEHGKRVNRIKKNRTIQNLQSKILLPCIIRENDKDYFLFDSGTDPHMCSRLNWFMELQTYQIIVTGTSNESILNIYLLALCLANSTEFE